MSQIESLKSRALAGFRERFGDDATHIAVAPGRINLIGEHTDYNAGFVFPVAIDRYIVVAAALSPDSSKVWSEAFPDPATFETALERTMHGWARFPAGCAWVTLDVGARTNINAFVVSDLPVASGVSSSAAMELSFLSLWNLLDGLNYEPKKLALLGQHCEHKYIGVNCGIMDQMASALGRAGSALLIDTRSLDTGFFHIPSELQIVLCDTGKARELGDSEYNQRRRECEAAAAAMGLVSLRDADMSKLDGTNLAKNSVQYSRARHVIMENERCLRFGRALETGDLSAIGSLMRASHESLRDDYEVSCQELDWMAEAAWSATGCVGARMTGAGFGGACVALVETESLERFLGDAEKGYKDRSNGLEPRFVTCRASHGAEAAQVQS